MFFFPGLSIYIHIYIYICVYMYIYIYICVFIYKYDFFPTLFFFVFSEVWPLRAERQKEPRFQRGLVKQPRQASEVWGAIGVSKNPQP